MFEKGIGVACVEWSGVDCIYYRVIGDAVEIMRVIGRQDFNESV